MSLINQMLRDLDRQRGPHDAGGSATPVGLQAVAGPANSPPRLRAAPAGAAVLIALAVLLLAGGQEPGNGPALAAQPRVLPLPIPPQASRHTPVLLAEPGAASEPAAPALAAQTTAEQTPAPADVPQHAVRETITQAIAAVEVQQTDPGDAATPAGDRIESASAHPPDTALLFNRAQTALARGEFRAAARLLEQLLAAEPSHVHARRQLAGLLIKQQRHPAAEALLQQGLQLTPGDAGMARLYARLLAQRNALAAALDTLAEPAGDAVTLALRGEIFSRMQRFADAAGEYRAALRQQPDNAVWWTGLAVALEQDTRPAAALDAYRQAAAGSLQPAVKKFVEQRIRALSAPGTTHQG